MVDFVFADGGQPHFAASGDFHGVLVGFGQLGEELVHLFRAFEIELVVCEAEAFFVMDIGLRSYAEEEVVRLGVLAAQVMRVVADHHAYLVFFGQLDELGVDQGLFLEAVVL